MSSEVALGLVSAVVIVHGAASFAMKHGDTGGGMTKWKIRATATAIFTTGGGTFLILWGLTGMHLKEIEFGLLSIPEEDLLHTGAHLILFGILIAIIPMLSLIRWPGEYS